MKKDLLMTLADANYIEQAKQLFSSVYWNAGWRGDYMLLAHNVPAEKLAWFRSKGILVYECLPLGGPDSIGIMKHPSTVLSKLYIFKDDFKKWDHVVFLDSDIIVRASLDALTKISGFAAPNALSLTMMTEFQQVDPKLFMELISEYPLRGRAFNTGVMAFSTDIIKTETFDKLTGLFARFGKLNAFGEEATVNLHFYKKWKILPMTYNLYPEYVQYYHHISPKNIRAIIIHFVASIKPWLPDSPFHKEWRENHQRAEKIDLSKVYEPVEIWSRNDMWRNQLHIHTKKYFDKTNLVNSRAVDCCFGMIGFVVMKISPKLHASLKPFAPKQAHNENI